MNRSNVRSTDHILDKQIKSWINRSNVVSTAQKLIKSYINRSKVRSTDKKLDQQINS